MSQRRSVNTSMTVSTRRNDVNECVRFILYREGSKIPIKRVDIKNHLTNTCDTLKNEVNAVIAGAERVLKEVYGYSLVKEQTSGSYMVFLEEPCDSLPSPLVDEKEQILLNVALTHIFMSGGYVKDDDLWNFLIKANLMEENDGTIRKLFTKKFNSQLYITNTKSGDGDLARTMFQWGPRASKEVSKMFILQKVAEAFGKTPDYWCEQHKNATANASSVRV